MNVITNLWRELVRRKLWPVALLLVAALVAVPLKLAKTPAPVAPIPAATLAKASKDAAMAKPIVQLAKDSGVTPRRRVLGQFKDPFAPAPLPKVKKHKAKPHATPTPAPTSGTGGGAAPPSAGPPAAPAPAPTPTTTVPKYSIKVRFGATDGELAESTLGRLEPLPSAEAPVLVYEGVENGAKVAVFSIPGSVTAQGDGHCVPSPSNCETLKLEVGDTEFITVTDTGDAATDAQFQLDLVKIYRSTTAEAGAPTASGSSALHKRLKGYRFDAATGTLKRVKHATRRSAL